jgi:subfamily B ATP-binding cassette protein MsbA
LNQLPATALPQAAPQSGLQTYLRLLAYLGPLWVAFAVSLLGFMLYALSQSAFAGLMQYLPAAFDNSPLQSPAGAAAGFTQESAHQLAGWEQRLRLDDPAHIRNFLPLALVAIVTVRGIGSYLGGYYITYVARQVVNRLRLDVFDHINRLPAAYLAERNSGELLSLITFNIEQVASAASNAIKVVVREGLTVIVLLSYIFYLNWKLSLLFVVLAPLIGGIIRLASGQFKKYSRRIQDSMGGITRVAAEAIRGFAVVRGFGGTEAENARFSERSNYALRQDLKLARVNEISTPIIQWLTYSALAALFWFGLDPALRGDMDAGQFLTYITAASLVAKPLRQLTNINAGIQRGIAAAESVFEVLDQAPESDSGVPLAGRLRGDIELKDLHFRYPGAGIDALQGISTRIEAGQRVAIVGRSGSGKSTLANLLSGLLPAPAGQILVDGIPLESIQLTSLRRQVAVVSQQTTLFAATIAENIAYGELAGASEAAIWRALEEANARGFVERLPGGLHTVLKEAGEDFSGGQRQRLALARAFLKDAPILLLDEATSAQDAESEALIEQALSRILDGRTALVIAHRLSTVEQADRILVLDEGRLIEAGTHAELLAQGRVYAQLYRQQFDGAT